MLWIPFCPRVFCESAPDMVGLMYGESPACCCRRPGGPAGAWSPVRPTDAQEPLQTGVGKGRRGPGGGGRVRRQNGGRGVATAGRSITQLNRSSPEN